nr:MAG TPA: hypothetical protein [Caudoviricetes sp.]
MSNLSQIKADSNWGDASNTINTNFQNMDVEMEKLKNSTTRFKGYFTNETNLKNKFPSPKRGDIAFVGEPYPGNVYDVLTDGSWHNTAKAPETSSVDLQDYVTKDDFEASQKEQDDKLTELDKKVREYNVSVLFPTEGLEESNKYTLENAISKIEEQYRRTGVRCSFINQEMQFECWEYQGGGWTDLTKWMPVNGSKIRKYADKTLIVTSGNISIDFSIKNLAYTDIRALSPNGKLLIAGGQAMANANINFSAIYNDNIPVNALILINPSEDVSDNGIYVGTESEEINEKINSGWYILGIIRTVDNKFICNVDKYSINGKVYYNTVNLDEHIKDFRPSLKYVSPAVLSGIEIPYTPNSILMKSGNLGSSRLNVSDPIIVFPGIILNKLRTPGDTNTYCAIAFFNAEDKLIGTYNGDAGKIVDEYQPDLPEGCLYLRYSTQKEDKPQISFSYKGSIKKTIYFLGSSSVQRLEMDSIVGDYKLDKLIDAKIIWSGVGAENMQAIVARGAIYPFFAKNGFLIPSDLSRVEITGGFVTNKTDFVFSNQQGTSLPKLNPVIVNGIKGTIVMDGSKFYFTRAEAGESSNVLNTDVITPNNIQYRGNILITMLGYNKGYEDTQDYIKYHEQTRKMFNTPHYLFVSRLCDGLWTTIDTIKEEEMALVYEYGSNAFLLRDYLSRFGISDGIKLGLLSEETEQDTEDRINGYIPTSLRGDGAHLNEIGYKIVSYKLSRMLEDLKFVE